MIFREEHIHLILDGTKTMTRRRHKYPRKAGKVYRVKKNYYKPRNIWIKILKAYPQRLGDITEEDAQREGGYTVQQFKDVWTRISGTWNPDEVITVYEFQVTDPPPKQSILTSLLTLF